MINITEAEIHSCTRKFLIENGFKFLSTKNNGEKFYYRIDNLIPSNYKQPDCICYKDDVVIIWEQKINFNALFKAQGNRVSDIQKLTTLLSNSVYKHEFLLLISKALCLNISSINLYGGISSKKTSKVSNERNPPNSFVHLSTIFSEEIVRIELTNAPEAILSLFPHKYVNHKL